MIHKSDNGFWYLQPTPDASREGARKHLKTLREHLEALPDRSIVATDTRVWIKSHPSRDSEWRCTNGGNYSSHVLAVHEADSNLHVLRIGPNVKPS